MRKNVPTQLASRPHISFSRATQHNKHQNTTKVTIVRQDKNPTTFSEQMVVLRIQLTSAINKVSLIRPLMRNVEDIQKNCGMDSK